jgi:hypothetical protein
MVPNVKSGELINLSAKAWKVRVEMTLSQGIRRLVVVAFARHWLAGGHASYRPKTAAK